LPKLPVLARRLSPSLFKRGILPSKLRCDGSFRAHKNGQARFNAYLEDYACLIDGLLSLYEATFDLRWIREAEELAGWMIAKFWDSQSRDFFFTSGDHESLIHRPKDFIDAAAPSGNSAAAGALLRLEKFTGSNQWQHYAIAILQNEAGLMLQNPSAVPHLLCADFLLGRTSEIAVIGDRAEALNSVGDIRALSPE
jgi:uncharacterized protein YyaL (SSP411 family)